MNFIKSFKDNIEYIDLWDVFLSGNLKEQEFALKLLKKVYDEVYLKSFPITAEQENFNIWKNNRVRWRKYKDFYVQTFTIWGFNLRTDPIFIGFVATSFYKGTGIGLMDYVVRVKEFQNIISAIDICEYQAQTLNRICQKCDGTDIKAILWEANNPDKVVWNSNHPNYSVDCMDPKKRIRAIEQNMKCLRLGFDYVQIPMRKVNTSKDIENGICNNLLLYQYNVPKYKAVTAKNILNWLNVFSKSCNGYLPAELNNDSVNKMLKQLQYMKEHHIPMLYEKQQPRQQLKIANIS